jgi:erythromycin esterase
VDWIKANLIPLKTCEPGSGFADLQRLKKLVGDARVVSLGEATHGTHEFFRMKHRLLEFLVSEMDFNVFAIEAPMPQAAYINRYLMDGVGDPAEALARISWPLDTMEMLDMIHWMRRYNLDPKHTRKLKFFGFDMQDPRYALKFLLGYLATVDPEQARLSGEALKPLMVSPGVVSPLTEAQLRPWAEHVHKLLARLEAQAKDYQDRSSAGTLVAAQQNARLLSQWAEFKADPLRAGRVRERAMAENVQWILQHEGPGARMVLWAHNLHVEVTPHPEGPQIMGAHLREALVNDMVVFGFVFNHGGFESRDRSIVSHPLRTFVVAPEPKATMEEALARAGFPLFILDLRKLPNQGVAANWFQVAQGVREMGSVYTPANPDSALRVRWFTWSFDALIFVDSTTPAAPNPPSARKEVHSIQ